MFRRNRRRRTGIWLPPDPYNRLPQTDATIPISNVTQCAVGYGTLLTPAAAEQGASVNWEFPLVGDFNENIIAGVVNPNALNFPNAGSMDDLTFGYSLKRVVGKLFIACAQDLTSDLAVTRWVVTAGIIVRRVNETGAATALNTFADSYDATRDPWLWRRSWLLGNQKQGAASNSSFAFFPKANWEYSSGLSDHHVDQKTRRTIKAEERLFLDITITNNDPGGEQTNDVMWARWDLRFFGKVFQSAGNKRNASR